MRRLVDLRHSRRVKGKLPLFLQNTLVVCLVEAAACQAKSFFHTDVDLTRDVVVSSRSVPPDPEPTDVSVVDSHHGVRVLAAL